MDLQQQWAITGTAGGPSSPTSWNYNCSLALHNQLITASTFLPFISTGSPFPSPFKSAYNLFRLKKNSIP